MGKYSFRTLFNQGDDIIEIVIRDSSGKTIEKRMANISDKEEVIRILRGLMQKYDINLDKPSDILSMDNEFFKI